MVTAPRQAVALTELKVQIVPTLFNALRGTIRNGTRILAAAGGSKNYVSNEIRNLKCNNMPSRLLRDLPDPNGPR
jgi:hypothetical protein